MHLSFAFPNLYVHADKPEDRFWLVYRSDEYELRGDQYYERLDRDEAEQAILRARVDDCEAERFLNRLSGRRSLFDVAREARQFSDGAQLHALVARGVLVAFRRRAKDDLDPSRRAVREERDAARAFAQLQRKVEIVPGRRCILVSGADYATIPNRDHYQVVPRGEGAALLAAAAAQSALPAPDRAMLERAASLLAADWRPPIQPKGLVLLRELPRRVASQRPEPAITPSQIRAMMRAEESVNLEIVVLGLDEQPLKDIKFTVGTPDDDTHEGDLGASGKTRVVSARKGTATVTLAWSEPDEESASESSA